MLQVIRYCFDPAAMPLWPAEAPVPAASDVPECEHCGTPRQFEFQVHVADHHATAFSCTNSL